MARVNSSRPNSPSPFSLGYWMHAEWAPHKATWLAWPHEKTDWPGKFAPIPWLYGDVVRRLSQAERVCILVNDSAAERAARDVLRSEEHTSELQSRLHLVCRLLLEKKKTKD